MLCLNDNFAFWKPFQVLMIDCQARPLLELDVLPSAGADCSITGLVALDRRLVVLHAGGILRVLPLPEAYPSGFAMNGPRRGYWLC